MMTDPKQPPDHTPAKGTAPDHNPTGTTPHGIPEGMEEHESKGWPNDDRQRSETAAHPTEKP